MPEIKESSIGLSTPVTKLPSKAYAAHSKGAALQPWDFHRRSPGPHDVLLEILYCGVCHSDIHLVNDDWGMSMYPMVPGHEIIGRVKEVGDHVKKFKTGDIAGIGCLVNSCRECNNCKEDLEQYCTGGAVYTYSGIDKDGSVTYGGYSNQIVCDEDFVLRVSDKIPLERAAPLLCAGITTYSPLRHWKVGAGDRVGIMGLGGLGHMAVKFAASFGAEVTVLSTSPNKEADAKALGAHKFLITKDEEQLKKAAGYFDFILDTVSAPHDYTTFLGLLRSSGKMVLVGLPTANATIPPAVLIFARRTLAGSLIGGLAETQEMLDYCAEHNIASDVEVINIKDINEAYKRMEKADVKYRFVIDMATL